MDSPVIATLTFDLMDPDGRDAFNYARLGLSSHLVIWGLWSHLHREVNKNGNEAAEPVLDKLLSLMDTYEVPLEVE